MNAAQFVAKWRAADLSERSASQQHFLDLCDLLGHPKPAEADPTGESFTFERGAAKRGGGEGWADVWKKGFFGWEYKGRHKDLDAAYEQLLQYREALENPPLLVVSDLDRILVHANFTNAPAAVHEITLATLDQPRSLEILRAVFQDPDQLKPGQTSAAITSEAAEQFAKIADSLRARGLDPAKVAHFLNRLVFCLFAEDIGLLPDKVFARLVERAEGDPRRFATLLGQLFSAMASGADFGLERIRHFNGNLFDDASVLDLTAEELKRVAAASDLNWEAVDPSVFGTLFERGLDPAKRSQLGAHYTSREDIETLVEPVVMQPLRREWDETKRMVESVLATGKKSPGRATPARNLSPAAVKKARAEADSLLHQFLIRLQNVKILDPACGSGNFLYVTLQKLKTLEKEVSVYAMEKGFQQYLPGVGPWQLYGIEVNPYAHDLAQTSIWIGFLQWTRANGYAVTQDPILRPMAGNFRCMDAILDLRGAGVSPASSSGGQDARAPREPEWPTVDFIVGNPPFLGGSRFWKEFGREYQERLWATYKGRVPGVADLCCYWFEKTRAHIAAGKCKRAGLLATQGIRGGANREVLNRIKETGGIFWAESDRPWILDGANVHVSMIAFDNGEETACQLDNQPAPTINANLTTAADVTKAGTIKQNLGVCFIGTKKAGRFNIPEGMATAWLKLPNPHGKPNSDVLRPWTNGTTLMQKGSTQWIIDAGTQMPLDEFCRYEKPYEYVLTHVKPERDANKEKRTRANFWLHKRPGPDMRASLQGLARCVAVVRHSKHRLFAWFDTSVLPDDGIYIFARADDCFFGILHSRVHDVWAMAQGTQVRERESGFRYTPLTCFETFPFPKPTKETEAAIAAAAKELNALRERWLNPPEWTREEILEFPATVGGPWDRFILRQDLQDSQDLKGSRTGNSANPGNPVNPVKSSVSANPVGMARYPRLVPKDPDSAAKLAKRTLTNLYNERPQWLADAHRKLDEAVSVAYGWPADLPDAGLLTCLLALNQERSAI